MRQRRGRRTSAAGGTAPSYAESEWIEIIRRQREPFKTLLFGVLRCHDLHAMLSRLDRGKNGNRNAQVAAKHFFQCRSFSPRSRVSQPELGCRPDLPTSRVKRSPSTRE